MRKPQPAAQCFALEQQGSATARALRLCSLWGIGRTSAFATGWLIRPLGIVERIIALGSGVRCFFAVGWNQGSDLAGLLLPAICVKEIRALEREGHPAQHV